MRLDFKPSSKRKTFFIIERNVEHEWRALDIVNMSDNFFDLEEQARVRAMALANKTGEKYRVLKIIQTTTVDYNVDVSLET